MRKPSALGGYFVVVPHRSGYLVAHLSAKGLNCCASSGPYRSEALARAECRRCFRYHKALAAVYALKLRGERRRVAIQRVFRRFTREQTNAG
jgi:hypothetical protein